MKKELDPNYDISVENMNDMTGEHERGNFKLTESLFGGKKAGEDIKKNILACGGRQIFFMKDGKFILEVEDDGIEYFYSEELNDLID